MKLFVRHTSLHFSPRRGLVSTLAFSVCLMGATYFGPASAQNANEPLTPIQKYVTLLGIHSATVAPNGLVFAHLTTSIDLNGGSAEEDSALSLGFGLGDARDGLGFQFTATGNSSSDNFDSFGYFGIKASHLLNSGASPTYLGLSIDRIGGMGAAADIDPAATLILTRFAHLGNADTGQTYPVMMTIGAGTHVRNLSEDPGIFLGAGIGLSRNFGLSAAWNGDYFDVGTAFQIGGLKNIGFTVSILDAFNQEDRQQLSLGISWFFNTKQRR